MNGVITSVGLMIWAYVSMRAMYQAEEGKSWFTFIEALIALALINLFCYQIVENSAALNDYKAIPPEEVDTVGVALAVGTLIATVVATVRAGTVVPHFENESIAALRLHQNA